MYGLVNRAIEQLVVSLRGQEGWCRVCREADWPDEGFVAMQTYDDGVTYRLVGAVSRELGIPPADVLRAFGEYWILYTADEGYGDMLTMCGNDLRSFLEGMNHMHARMEATMPDIRPPHFRVEDGVDGEMILHYESEREGLSPMVEGLIVGLGRRFGQPVQVRLRQPRTAEYPVDIFEIRLQS